MQDLETTEGFLDYIYSNIARWSMLEFPRSIRPDYKYVSISVTCKDPYMLSAHGSLTLTTIDSLDVKIKEYLMLTSTQGKSEANIMSIVRAVVDPNDWGKNRVSLKRVVKATAFLDYNADSFHTSISSVSVLDSDNNLARSYKEMPQINIKKAENDLLYYTIIWQQYQAQYLSLIEPGRISLYINKKNGNVVKAQCSWFLVDDDDLNPAAKHRMLAKIDKEIISGSVTGPSYISYKNSSPNDMIDIVESVYLDDDSRMIDKSVWERSARVKKYRIQLVKAAMKLNE
jgi:hypothetical protein